jgi:peptide/nickel transport system substrate-binding protein
VDMIDDYTVRIYTKGVRPYFPDATAAIKGSQAIVQPKNYIQQKGVPYFSLNPMGSGPYKFVKWTPGDSVQYQAADNYWGVMPGYKNLTIIQVPEYSVRLAMLKTAAADFTDANIGDVPGLESSGFKTVTADGVAPRFQFEGTQYASAKGMPAADVRVRQALSLAVNRDEINKTFFYGKAATPWAGGVPPYPNDIDLAYWTTYAANYFKYDPAQAQQLLTQAGYPNGFGIKLYTSVDVNAPYLNDLAQVIQGYWKKIGVTAELVVMDKAAIATIRQAPADQLIGQALMTRSPSNPVTIQPIEDSFANVGTWRLLASSPKESGMPEIAALFAQIDPEADSVKRNQLLAQVIDKVAQTWLSVPISQTYLMYVYNSRLQVPADAPAVLIGMGATAKIIQHATK